MENENKQPKVQERVLLSRMKRINPELSEDALDDEVIKYMDELEGKSSKAMEGNKQLAVLLDGNPELAGLIQDIAKGASLAEAVARNIGDVAPADGDPDYRAWEQARQERESRVAKSEEFINNVTANQEASIRIIDQFVSDNDLSDEETASLLDNVEATLTDALHGKISPEFLAVIYKAMNRDKDVADAEKIGEAKAKNKEKKKEPTGDGIPKPKSNNGSMEQKGEFSEGIAGVIDSFNRRHNQF